MAVVSVRLNEEDERILTFLTEYLHEDKSSLIRKSLYDMYEDIQDIKFIEDYIETAKTKEKTFIPADELFL